MHPGAESTGCPHHGTWLLVLLLLIIIIIIIIIIITSIINVTIITILNVVSHFIIISHTTLNKIRNDHLLQNSYHDH